MATQIYIINNLKYSIRKASTIKIVNLRSFAVYFKITYFQISKRIFLN